MSQTELRYRLTMEHKCGSEFQMNVVESPPRILICTGCHEILKLSHFSYDDGATYLASGNYWERKDYGSN